MFIAYLHIYLLLTHTKKGTADCQFLFSVFKLSAFPVFYFA